MKKLLLLSDPLVSGYTKRNLQDIFNNTIDLSNQFTQRKSYDEYYFDSTNTPISITVELLDKILLDYVVTIDHDSLIVKIP